jgi:hypothetical protein
MTMTTEPTLYIPYTRISEATEVFLHTYGCVPGDVRRIDVTDNPWGYTEHLAARWVEGNTFLNLEHDVVPWPGALQDLLACERPWCFFGYLPNMDWGDCHAAPFGCVKFDASLIARTQDVWHLYREKYLTSDKPWQCCDIHFGEYMEQNFGWEPHQHTPAVLNANPALIDTSTTNDGHQHIYVPSPYADPGITPVLVCAWPGCRAFAQPENRVGN